MRIDYDERSAARVLLLDAQDRLLLLHGYDPADRARGGWWFTPGGGLDPGEEPAVGAARELYEETGLRIPAEQFAGPVYEQVVEFPLDGRRYRQSEAFYTVRCDRWDVDTSGFTDLEVRSVDGNRWWSVAELRRTDERVYPAGLADLVAGLLADPAGTEA
jgi:8-oxo-dGTP pyrophosphatase MutT (NUDIX family)